MEISGHHPRAAFPAAFSHDFGDAPYHLGGAGPDEYVEAVAARATAQRTGSHDAVRAADYHEQQKAARPSEICAEVSEERMSDDLYGADGDDVISACLTSSEDEGDYDDDDSDAEGGGDGRGAHWAALAQLMPHSAPCLSSFDAADMYGESAEELPADAPDEASALQRSGGGNGTSSTSRREFNRTGSAGYRPALRASQMSAAAAAAARVTAASSSAATRSPPQYLPSGAAAASASPQRLTTTSPSSFRPNAPANTPTAAPPSLPHSPKRYNSPASSAYSTSPSRYSQPSTGAALLSSNPSFVSPYRSSSPVYPPDAQNASAAGASRSPPPHSSGPSPQGQSPSPQTFAHNPTYPDHSPSALNQTPHGSGYSMRSTGYGVPGRSSSPSPGANGYGTGPAPNTAGGRSFASGEAMERRRPTAERSEHPYRRQQSEPAVRAPQGQLPAAAAASAVAPAPCERVPRSFSNSSRSSAGELTAHRPRHSISESMKNAARAAVQAASVASQNNSHEQQHHSQAQQSKEAASGRSCTMAEGSYAASRSSSGIEGRPKRIVAAAVPAGAGTGAGAVAASTVAAVAAAAGPPPMQRKSRSLTRTDGAELSLKQMLLQADESVPVSAPQAFLSRVPTTKRRGKDVKSDLDARAGEGAGEVEGKPLQRTRSGNKTVLVFEIPDPDPVRDLEEKSSKGTGSRSSSRGMRSGSLTTTSAAAAPTPASRSTVQGDSYSAGGGNSAPASSQVRYTSKPKILKGILKSSKSQKDVGVRAAGSELSAAAASIKPRAKSAGVKRVYV